MAEELRPGLVGEARITVGAADLASALGSGSIHVYGTDVSRIGSSVRRYYDHPIVAA